MGQHHVTERELKLAADAETIARIRKSRLVSSRATGPSRTRDEFAKLVQDFMEEKRA